MDPETGLPMAFGRASTSQPKASVASQAKHARAQEPLASASTASVSLEGPIRAPVSDGDDAEDGSPSAAARLPISHEVVMKEHSKTISALALDPSGTRFATGSYDYDCKLWDFGGMTAAFKPFRSFEPKDGHSVHALAWSNTGRELLVATGGIQVKMYDRDGLDLGEWVKGDHYIRDLRNTEGHVAAVSCIAWHPKKNNLFLTGSEDGTLRIWEADNKRKSKSCIVVKSKERGGRTKVTACAYSPDAKWIAAACEDGALHLWKASSNFARSDGTVEGAHEKGTITSDIVFSHDGTRIATRGGDGTVKLWDPKSFKKPLATAEGLPTLNPETNLVFSPDDQLILTGTAGSKAGRVAGGEKDKMRDLQEAGLMTKGSIVVLSRDGLKEVRRIEVSDASVVRVLWHARINQILAGSSDGSLHVLYSPELSTKGITIAAARAPRKRQQEEFFATSADGAGPQQIIAPHSLPMFKEDINQGMATGQKRQRERERHDPKKTMKPMVPITGRGSGGRIGAAATQHVVQGLVRDNMRDQDPREALLKYATANVEDNEWTAAWTATQPKPVFDTRPHSDDEKGEKKKK